MSFEMLSSPEFLAEGEAVRNLREPDRVLIGVTNDEQRLCSSFGACTHIRHLDKPTEHTNDSKSFAEFAKLRANAMLAQRISGINTISAICERTGADIAEVQVALGSDSR